MSPSEFDLRAALREGEGDGVDAGRVIVHADRYRAERRSRLLNTAAAAVVVAGLAVGGVFLLRSGGDDSGSATSSAGGASANSPRKADGVKSAAAGQRAAASSAAAVPAATATSPVTCPAQYPRTLLPTGPATKAPLFARAVSSVVVCSYGSPASAGTPTRLVLSGSRATELVDRLEQGSPTLIPRPCPSVTTTQQTALAILGVTAAGTRLPVVTTTVDSTACNLHATNGIAVRWDWQPPPDLLHELADLTADPTGPASPSGNQGSPVR